MKKLLITLTFLFTITNVISQLVSQHFSNTSPVGWSSTPCSGCTWVLNYDGSSTGNYRSDYDATKYSARLPSATTGGGIYLYIPVTFTNHNIYTITFYTKRACNISLLVNETANQTTPLSTQTINNASCSSNFSTWYSWSFSYTASYSGSGYIQILINTVYGGPTSVYLDDINVVETFSLPIELLYFDGDPHVNYNKLHWITATENNNDYFNIYRSVDGVYFDNIFTIKGAGDSRTSLYYEVIDRSFDPVINYYVLRQTDFDGRWKESDIISIDNRSESAPMLLKVTNLLGQEVNDDATGVLLYHYSDGTILKRIH